MACTAVLEALRARYERDKLVIFSAEKEMTLSLAQALSRSPSQEQAAAVMAELAAILASNSFSSSKRCQDFLEFVVKRALAGDYGESGILPAFHHTVRQYGIQPAYLHDSIIGAQMDLTINSYPSFELLERYCYCVAGAVGLCCVHVFGFSDAAALELAPKLGIAFQLTNILRDVPEDLAMGRIYLPQEDLKRFGCTERDLAGSTASPAFVDLMRFEAGRAWHFYEEGSRLLKLISPDSQAALWTLIRIYSGILRKIETIHYDVLAKPHPGLSRVEKAWIMVRAGAGLWQR